MISPIGKKQIYLFIPMVYCLHRSVGLLEMDRFPQLVRQPFLSHSSLDMLCSSLHWYTHPSPIRLLNLVIGIWQQALLEQHIQTKTNTIV